MPDGDPIQLDALATSTGAHVVRQNSVPLSIRRDPGVGLTPAVSPAPDVVPQNQTQPTTAANQQGITPNANQPPVRPVTQSQTNFEAESRKKALKWAKVAIKIVTSLTVLAGVAWGVFSVLSWQLGRQSAFSQGKAQMYGFCIDHKDTLPTEQDRADCKVIIESTSIQDLSKGLFDLAKSKVHQRHKRVVSFIGNKAYGAMIQSHSFGLWINDAIIFLILLLDINFHYPGTFMPKWSTVSALLFGPRHWFLQIFSCMRLLWLWPLWLAFTIKDYRFTIAFALVVIIYTNVAKRNVLLFVMLVCNIYLAIFLNRFFISKNQYMFYLHIIANLMDYFNAQVLIKFSYPCSTDQAAFNSAMHDIHIAWLTTFWVICDSPIDLASISLYEPGMTSLLVIHRASCSNDCGYPFWCCRGDPGNIVQMLSRFCLTTSRFFLLSKIEPRLLRVMMFLVWELQIMLVSGPLMAALSNEDTPEQPSSTLDLKDIELE